MRVNSVPILILLVFCENYIFMLYSCIMFDFFIFILHSMLKFLVTQMKQVKVFLVLE